ncbi:MAG TPA: DnaD domain protein [Thermomicrobiales bacterium]|nr:DnaD domain protein [Thermomicrobiales bacterium]
MTNQPVVTLPVTSHTEIPIPREFLAERIAFIDDPAELHVTLAVFRLAADSGSTPPAVSEDAVLRDGVLARTFHEDRKSSKLSQRIRRGLQYATARDSIVQVVLKTDGHDERWYVPASGEHRAALEAVLLEPGAWPIAGIDATIVATAPSVFSLYEKNIGMLTPLLTDQIESAMELYPLEWIEDAIREAVTYNKRNWRYVQRVLENWSVNGRGDSQSRGNQHATNWGGTPEPFDPAVYKQKQRRRGST